MLKSPSLCPAPLWPPAGCCDLVAVASCCEREGRSAHLPGCSVLGSSSLPPWGAHSGLGSPARPPESVPAPRLLSWLRGLGGVASPLWASVDKEKMNLLQPAVFSPCPVGLPESFETPFNLAPTQTYEIRVSEGTGRQLSQPRCKVHRQRGRGLSTTVSPALNTAPGT